WSLLGAVIAAFDCLRGSEAQFQVTPKGSSEGRTLPFRILAPYLSLVLASGLPVIFLSRPTLGYYAFPLLNCVIYSGVVITITVGHWLENSRLWEPNRLAWRAKTAVVILSLAIPLAGSVRLPDGIEGLLWMPSNVAANALRSSRSLTAAAG